MSQRVLLGAATVGTHDSTEGLHVGAAIVYLLVIA